MFSFKIFFTHFRLLFILLCNVFVFDSSSAGGAPSLPTSVVLHPLVLLSVVDHYNRVTAGSKRRVVGILLGTM